MQRKKDGHPSNQTIVDFFVNSESYWRLLKPGIVALCDTYNARAYINMNVKSSKQIVFKMADTVLESMKLERYKPMSVLTHSCASINSNVNKVWIIDVDDKNVDLQSIIDNINSCKGGYTRMSNVIDTIPTPNGYHILTNPFNTSEYTGGWEIKKNSLTLLYTK
jgi:hypothetical protein